MEVVPSQRRRARVLVVANKELPATDYRVAFAQYSALCDVTLAMPVRRADNGVASVRFGEGLRPGDAVGALDLWRVLRQAEPPYDFAHFYSPKLAAVGPVVARAARVRSVVTMTGTGRVETDDATLYRALRPAYRRALARSLRLAETVLFQNRAAMTTLAHELPELGGRCQWIGSASAVLAANRTERGATPLRVLHVARLLPSKGIRDFLTVAAAFRPDVATFTLVGPPSLGERRLLSEVEVAHRSGVVIYLGELTPERLAEEYARSDVLFFPSHGEGLSRAMLEAGIAGLCPIGYDVQGVIDLLDDGRGFVLPLGDVAAAVETIDRLCADRSLVRRKAEAFHANVTDEYSMGGFVDRLDAVYAALELDGPVRPSLLQHVFDVTVACSVLVPSLPMWLVIAAAIKLDSPGPVFFRANRAGQGGHPFELLKFRTMSSAAPTWPAVTAEGDPRITRVGAVLRRTKLDELPNLLNVLRRDLAMIGPRPEDPRYVARYTSAQRPILRYLPGVISPATLRFRNEERLLASAGISAEALYLDEVMPSKIAIDLDYFRRRTVRSDVRLLAAATWSVVRTRLSKLVSS